MKSFLEEYGFAILAAIVVILLIAMCSPVGNMIKTQVVNMVSGFATSADKKLSAANNDEMSANILDGTLYVQSASKTDKYHFVIHGTIRGELVTLDNTGAPVEKVEDGSELTGGEAVKQVSIASTVNSLDMGTTYYVEVINDGTGYTFMSNILTHNDIATGEISGSSYILTKGKTPSKTNTTCDISNSTIARYMIAKDSLEQGVPPEDEYLDYMTKECDAVNNIGYIHYASLKETLEKYNSGIYHWENGGWVLVSGMEGTKQSTGLTPLTEEVLTYDNKAYKKSGTTYTPYTGTVNNISYSNGVATGNTPIQIVDGDKNGKHYHNDVLFTGTCNNILYKEGVKFTGLQDNKYYLNGILGTGNYNGYHYTNGIQDYQLDTLYQKDGKYYYNGSLANGTYNGKEYVDGVEKVVNVETETWVLNKHLLPAGSIGLTANINFTANGVDYSSIQLRTFGQADEATMMYYQNNSINNTVYVGGDYWENEANRTIVFKESPSGELLTWLQANATKQGVTMIKVQIQSLIGADIYEFEVEEGTTWDEYYEANKDVSTNEIEIFSNSGEVMYSNRIIALYNKSVHGSDTIVAAIYHQTNYLPEINIRPGIIIDGGN